MHQQLVDSILKNLKGDRSLYFSDFFRALEGDKRSQNSPNIVYAVMKETVPLIPPYLPAAELIDMLFKFVAENGEELQTIMYSREYVTDNSVLHKITNKFIERVATLAIDRYNDGNLDTGEPSKRHYGPPYDNVDFPFADK